MAMLHGELIELETQILTDYYVAYEEKQKAYVNEISMDIDTWGGTVVVPIPLGSPNWKPWLNGFDLSEPKTELLQLKNTPKQIGLSLSWEDYSRAVKSGNSAMVDTHVTQFAGRVGNLSRGEAVDALERGEAVPIPLTGGEMFFGTNHRLDGGKPYDSLVPFSLASFPCQIHGSPTLPSLEEFAWLVMYGIMHMMTAENDKGDRVNDDVMEFTVVVPLAYAAIAGTVATKATFQNDISNPVIANGYKINVHVEILLSWTDTFFIGAADGGIAPFAKTTEQAPELYTFVGKTSETATLARRNMYLAFASSSFGYVHPMRCVKVQVGA